MIFPSINSLLYVDKEYANLKSFSAMKKLASKGNSEHYKYQTINCDRVRKSYAEKSLERINCPARISVILKLAQCVVCL